MTSGGTVDFPLLKRVAVAVVFGPVIVWIFFVGGPYLFLFLTFLSLIAQWELFGMFGARVGLFHRILAYTAGTAIMTDGYIAQSAHFFGIISSVLAASFVLEIITGRLNNLENITLSLFTAVYPAVFLTFLIRLARFPSLLFGAYMRHLLVYMLIIVWIFDTASYFSGKTLGRHPFFPGISPRKTMEGFAGGAAAVLAAGAAAGILIEPVLTKHFVFISILICVAGQAGDLSESIIKRNLGVKDSSHILPGHGGILDRFDSLFFAAPAVYWYVVLCQWITGTGI